MSAADHALARAKKLQQRICGVPLPAVDRAADLHDQLKKALLGAWREERLVTSPHEINSLLKLGPNPFDRGTAESVLGGLKDFKRSSEDGLFKRRDGALFNFSIAVRGDRPIEVLAYDFELRLPPGVSPSFVRFDLNAPWQDNNDQGLRSHLHPGHDDLLAPSAVCTPLELLELFLYGLRLPDKPRA